jgi:CheY-like chemotaxis protein
MGLDVLRWIRSQPEMWVPVVVMSASSEDSDMMEAYRLGCNGFLVKPSESSKLESMAGAITHFWLTHNALPSESDQDLVEISGRSNVAAPNRARLPATVGRQWHPGMTATRPSAQSLATPQ